MLNKEDFENIFKNISDELFRNCIVEKKTSTWEQGRMEYIEYSLEISNDIMKLLNEYDNYLELSDVIGNRHFIQAVKEVYYDEINDQEYLRDAWNSYKTTYKCFVDYEGDLEKIKSVISNKLEQFKETYIKILCNTYDEYVKSYGIKKDYIEFANKIKKIGFETSDYQRRGEIRVPCTFEKTFDSLTLYVRKNVNNYRIYLKCDIGGRYGMTVEEFDKNYQFLKTEESKIRNALLGENIV